MPNPTLTLTLTLTLTPTLTTLNRSFLPRPPPPQPCRCTFVQEPDGLSPPLDEQSIIQWLNGMPSSSRTQALGELLYVKVQVHRHQLSHPPARSPCTERGVNLHPAGSGPGARN